MLRIALLVLVVVVLLLVPRLLSHSAPPGVRWLRRLRFLRRKDRLSV